jgi:methionyl-tRNA formyltransferase
MNIIFFGSFQHYSALILQSLIDHQSLKIVGVITTPPMPVGRKQVITKTPVHLLAEKNNIPVFTPEKLDSKSLKTLSSYFKLPTSEKVPDFFITAGYGQILPKSWLTYPKLGCLNLHFSLLPSYRGANPAEWAIMCGETKTGITLMTMSQKLDGGDIIEQRELAIAQTDTRETLYQKLYELGARQLPDMLIRHAQRQKNNQFDCQQSLAPKPQPKDSPTPYAALLKRQDGFIPWPTITSALQGQSVKVADFPSPHLQTALNFGKTTNHQSPTTLLASLPRALATYPSLWTIVPTSKGDKRMKILSFKPFTVQIEGQQPAQFNQVKNLII